MRNNNEPYKYHSLCQDFVRTPCFLLSLNPKPQTLSCHAPHYFTLHPPANLVRNCGSLTIAYNDPYESIWSLITNVNISFVQTQTNLVVSNRFLASAFLPLVPSEELRIYRAQQKEAEVVRLKEAMQGGRVRMMTTTIPFCDVFFFRRSVFFFSFPWDAM